MDPQANATSSFGMEKKSGFGVYEPLLTGSDLANRVQSTGEKTYGLCPRNWTWQRLNWN